jgi:hypothetical protein
MVCLTLLTIAAITFPSLISQLLTAAALLPSSSREVGQHLSMQLQHKMPIPNNSDHQEDEVTTSTEEDATKITGPRSPLFLIVEEDRQQQTTQVDLCGEVHA